MSRRRTGFVACLAVVVFAAAGVAGAARPITINKTKSDNREVSYASDLCAVATLPPKDPIYEPAPPPVFERCRRGIHASELLGFQVVAPRSVPVYISGELEALGPHRIHAKVIILVDGVRVARKPLVFSRSDKAADLQITGTAELPKGVHRVELSIRPAEEEGLVGLTRRFSKLTVSTEGSASP